MRNVANKMEDKEDVQLGRHRPQHGGHYTRFVFCRKALAACASL